MNAAQAMETEDESINSPVISKIPDTVWLSGPDHITVKNLSLHSREAYEFLSGADEPAMACADAIITGCIALSRSQTGLDTDMVEQKFQKLLGHVQASIHKAFDPLEAGSAMQKLNQYLTQQGNALQEVLCRGAKGTEEVNRQIVEFSGNIRTQVAEIIGNAITTDSVGLGLLLRQMRQEIASLRDTVVAARTEIESSAPAIGANFEELCFNVIFSWAKAHQGIAGTSIVVTDTRTATGLIGKQGDALVDLADDVSAVQRIAIEMKSQEKISVPSIYKVLSESLQNRSAQKSIYVAPDASYLPREIGAWAQPTSDKIITILPFLEMALKIAACQLEVAAKQETLDGPDLEQAIDMILGIQDSLKQFNGLFTSARSAIKQNEKTLSLAMGIRDMITEKADSLLSIIRTGGEQKHESEN